VNRLHPPNARFEQREPKHEKGALRKRPEYASVRAGFALSVARVACSRTRVEAARLGRPPPSLRERLHHRPRTQGKIGRSYRQWSRGGTASFRRTVLRVRMTLNRAKKGRSAIVRLNRAIIYTSHNYEVSATPCKDRETERAPSRGVAGTLLHETAGRESTLWRFGDGRERGRSGKAPPSRRRRCYSGNRLAIYGRFFAHSCVKVRSSVATTQCGPCDAVAGAAARPAVDDACGAGKRGHELSNFRT
jgi:hypothetical protein